MIDTDSEFYQLARQMMLLRQEARLVEELEKHYPPTPTFDSVEDIIQGYDVEDE